MGILQYELSIYGIVQSMTSGFVKRESGREREGQDTEYRTVHRNNEMVTDRYREAERQIDR